MDYHVDRIADLSVKLSDGANFLFGMVLAALCAAFNSHGAGFVAGLTLFFIVVVSMIYFKCQLNYELREQKRLEQVRKIVTEVYGKKGARK